MTLNAFFLPAPTGGINARDNKATMPITDALDVQNVICRADEIEIAKAPLLHEEYPQEEGAPPGGGGSCHCHVTSQGTQILLVFYRNNDNVRKLYNLTTAGSPVDLTNDVTLGTTVYISTMFKHRTFFVDPQGVNDPLDYSAGDGLAKTAWSGPANVFTLCGVSVYKRRLYFIELAAASIWYGGVDAVTGALTEFPIDDYLTLGGDIWIAQPTTAVQANGPAELFCIISQKGEVLVYQGDYPGASTWALVGHYFMPPLVGKRGYFYLNGGLYIIHERGITSISEVMTNPDPVALTDKIEPLLAYEIGRLRELYIANDASYMAIPFPTKNLLFFQYRTRFGSESYRHRHMVMDLTTRAWSSLTLTNPIDVDFGAYFASLCVVGGKLYGSLVGGFSMSGDGVFSLFDDNATALVQWSVQHPYTYMDDGVHKKQITQVQPIINQGAADDVTISIDVDYRNTYPDSTTVTQASGYNADEYQIASASGRAVSVKLSGSTASTMDYSGTAVLYETGDVI
jgi:hypothetical protein